MKRTRWGSLRQSKRQRQTHPGQNASERRLIREAGGDPNRRKGADGSRNGRPIEVKQIKNPSANRFRIGRTAHARMMKAKGDYVFKARGKKAVKISAAQVDRSLKSNRRKWYSDKRPNGSNYRHTFIRTEEVGLERHSNSQRRKKSRRRSR